VSSAVVPMSGPLTPYVDGFAAVLAAQGYAAGTVMLYRQYVGDLSRWLETGALGADVISEGKSKSSWLNVTPRAVRCGCGSARSRLYCPTCAASA
jgi:hypothetical protein